MSVLSKKFVYPDSTRLILAKDFKKLAEEFPKVMDTLSSCKRNADARGLEGYALDVAASWVYEDALLFNLKKHFKLSSCGSDSSRAFLNASDVRADSDYEFIRKDGEKQKIELVNSYTNFWDDKNQIDLREKKLDSLIKSGSLLLCIDLFNRTFMLINPLLITSTYLEVHPVYKKPAYRIDITSIKRFELNINNLQKIISVHL